MLECPIEVWVEFGDQCAASFRRAVPLYLQLQIPYPYLVAHASTFGNRPRGLLDRLVADELPDGRDVRGLALAAPSPRDAVRQLETDLEQETGLTLADFDVLAQLAPAGGELRMTELADRALISRSGMTRRVARLVEEGLVRRANADADGRGVVVASDRCRRGPPDRDRAGPRPRGRRLLRVPARRRGARRARARPRQGHGRLHVRLKGVEHRFRPSPPDPGPVSLARPQSS